MHIYHTIDISDSEHSIGRGYLLIKKGNKNNRMYLSVFLHEIRNTTKSQVNAI